MTTGQLSISAVLCASAEKIYAAYLSSREHAAITGSPAKITPKVGGKFMAWDGYISGEIMELVPNRRIVQTWRTTEFKKDDPDSIVEIDLEERAGRTKLTLAQKNLPRGTKEEYKNGWRDYYIKPMKDYFSPGA
jgi:activator of HSP90 ATPase